MKRYKILEKFLPLFGKEDLLIFSGFDMCREVFEHDKDNYFYIDSHPTISTSFALGVSIAVDRRVFVFMDDSVFLSEIGALANMAVSGMKNIVCVIFTSGYYHSSAKFPTIYENISSDKHILFGLGLVVYSIEDYFKDKMSLKHLDALLKNIRGPSSILIKTSVGTKKDLNDFAFDKIIMKNRFIEYVDSSGV